MSKYSELADRLERLVIMDEVGSNNSLAREGAAALRELEAEKERHEDELVRYAHAFAEWVAERDRLRDQVTEIPTLCRRYEAERDRLREALRGIAEWHWPASEYRYGSDSVVHIARAALQQEGK